MRIVTDSKAPEEPKNPNSDNLYQIYQHFAPPERLEEVRNLYLHGGLAYGALKQELAELILAAFAEPRRKYAELINDHAYLDAAMAGGAEKARAIAQPVLTRMRKAIGLDR
jgi:tryptophanyl-tRNA synthetase